MDLFHAYEVLEAAKSILERHRDDDLAKKTFAVQEYLEMREHHPERSFSESLDRALADLTAAVHRHLNAELDAVGTLFFRLGESAKVEDKQKD